MRTLVLQQLHLNMRDSIPIELAKAVAFSSIQRCAAREYPSPATRSKAFMEIFGAKLEHAIDVLEKEEALAEKARPFLATIADETKEGDNDEK